MTTGTPVVRRNIRPLPDRLINKIAAGEVVERPSSVVKELTENALDAGATRIDIIIEKAGSKLIKIVDNGCGIPAEQIETAFGRHATSKISTFTDLDNLNSYGFRGEALPSIASVSRMRMVSRTADAELGAEIIYEGGVLQEKRPVAAPAGTTVEVENLFFNTPARRKFLKTESTEARHVARVAMAMALGRYTIGFSFTHNERLIFVVPPDQTLEERVATLLGIGKNGVAVKAEDSAVQIHGYLGTPDLAQNQRTAHYIFINGRLIHSVTLSHAILSGYGELIPRGLHPVGALLLTVSPQEIDVNVHPAKTEVRLAREREIYESIHRAVKMALQRDSIIPSFKSTEPQPNGAADQRIFSLDTPTPQRQQASIPGIFNRHAIQPQDMHRLYRLEPETHPMVAPREVRVDAHTGEIIEEGAHTPEVETGPSDGIHLLGRFSDLYLLIKAGEDLFIVDQHTAHERVLYEEMLRKVDSNAVVAQQLLLPVQVELSPEQLTVFDESVAMLNHTGFIVSAFGGRMVNIEAVPSILTRKSPERVLLKVLDDIATLTKAGQDLKKAMAQSMACRAAVMAGDRLTDAEAVGLVAQLLKCENKYSCPHGRPTFVRLSRFDIDRQFGRA